MADIIAGLVLIFGSCAVLLVAFLHRAPLVDDETAAEEAELDAEWLAILRAIKSDTPEFDRLAAERTLREIRGL